jgi:DNA topoisomerase-1
MGGGRGVRGAGDPRSNGHDPARTPDGLRYVTDDDPGIRRLRCGRGFRYVDPRGRTVRDVREIERIRRIVIPPAWEQVWISPDPRGHIQATGRDGRGRKQYRYHPRWREHRDGTKFARLAVFGAALPSIRERAEADLRLHGLPRERALAVVVDLLDRTLVRVGNPEYARENGSYGLTTLRDEHVDVDGATVRLCFRGKGGRRFEVDVHDRRVARVVRRMQDLPGHRLFEYVDDQGEVRAVGSGDVNEYLREVGGGPFSAKDYRTWGGTVHVVERLLEVGEAATRGEAESNVREAIASAAVRLGNTPAVTRRSYVHPLVVDAYLEGTLPRLWEEASRRLRSHPPALGEAEAILLSLLASSPPASGSGTRASRPAERRRRAA